MPEVHDAAQRGFTAGAASYTRGRPGYPPDIVKWLQTQVGLAPGKQVLELGAGTGKFTASLALTGAQVHVIEPVSAMLSHLRESVPAAIAMSGTAEAIGMEDRSVDAVVCAQSFHWFASSQALAEMARVLKPGGMLGLVWNVPDEEVPWVAALEAVLRPFESTAPHAYRRGTWRSVFPSEHFMPLAFTEYPHSHTGSVQRVVVERVLSLSYVAGLVPAERDGLMERIRLLLTVQPDTRGRVEIEFPYRTHAYHCKVRGTR
ncbi:MAG: methyltransferase domain-containing protein [Proteobacteria bacterium]|nr:methyltransferase domain-containing protein [Pseudomonadota bacterium]